MFTASRFLLLATALAVAAPLAAQQAMSDSSGTGMAPVAITAPALANATAATPAAGPVMQPASVSFRVQSASASQPMMAMPENGESSQNVALMVVGGAGLIVGAVIGGRSGTIVMLGSGILGLVGLFRYLQ